MREREDKNRKNGVCGFIGYSAQAREYWASQSPTSAKAKHKFGECPQCSTGLNAESDYIMIVGAGAPIIRCISCYVSMII